MEEKIKQKYDKIFKENPFALWWKYLNAERKRQNKKQ